MRQLLCQTSTDFARARTCGERHESHGRAQAMYAIADQLQDACLSLVCRRSTGRRRGLVSHKHSTFQYAHSMGVSQRIRNADTPRCGVAGIRLRNLTGSCHRAIASEPQIDSTISLLFTARAH